MSPKKSPSNIRPEDREEFNTKLQALHMELQNKESWRNNDGKTRIFLHHSSMPFQQVSWGAWEYHNGLDLIVPRMARECSYPCIDEDDNIYHRRITHADKIQSIVYWDKAAMDYFECRTPYPIRKLIQQQYTDGEDRAIGEIIA